MNSGKYHYFLWYNHIRKDVIHMEKICIGCGSVLQTKDNTKPGYIRENKYKDSKYCQRCFKIIHYNEKIETKLENINNYIITEINKKAKNVYFLIDFLNINNETINTFKRIKCNKTLIISKLDVIPKSIKKTSIIEFIKDEYNIADPIDFVSTKKNINTKSFINRLIDNNIKEAYILGYTNSGKSSFINKILDVYDIKDKITTSTTPNTTMDFIEIKLPGIKLYDSPGFLYENTMYQDNEFDLIKRTNPREFLKPITYQLKEDTSIIIENRIKIKPGNINITLYLSNEINIKKSYSNELENLQKHELYIPDNSDLVIRALGFIKFKKEAKITIYCNEDIIERRKSIFR